jgi:hypothetical protein
MEFKDTGDYFKFYIQGLLHLCISKEEFISIYSYINGIEDKAYYVQLDFKTTSVTITYKTKELFEIALKCFDKSIK